MPLKRDRYKNQKNKMRTNKQKRKLIYNHRNQRKKKTKRETKREYKRDGWKNMLSLGEKV